MVAGGSALDRPGPPRTASAGWVVQQLCSSGTHGSRRRGLKLRYVGAREGDLRGEVVNLPQNLIRRGFQIDRTN
jgi:hypothetical protein